MAITYDSQGYAKQMPFSGVEDSGYQLTQGVGPKGGSGYLGTMGMSPEFNDQLFMNLQKNISAGRKSNRQSVIDNTSRFGMGGGQQQALMNVNRDAADASVQALSSAELQGAQMGRQDRQMANDRFFNAEQNQINRKLQQSLQDNLLGQDTWQFNANRSDAQQAQIMNMFMSMAGMGMGK